MFAHSTCARRRFLVAALVISLTASILGLSDATPAVAAIGDGERPVITWNAQGATQGRLSIWTHRIGELVAPRSVNPVVAIQEAGPSEPTHAFGTNFERFRGNDLAALPAAVIQGTLPPFRHVGGPQEVRHSQWNSGGVNHDVYFLQTDWYGDTWRGGRNNLAIVTERAADEVAIIPNPQATQTNNWHARPALGVRLGSTWYFSVHALSDGTGSDAPGLLRNIRNFLDARPGNEDAVVGGDFNRGPMTFVGQAALPANTHIYASRSPTHPSTGSELDYFVYFNRNGNFQAGVTVQRLPPPARGNPGSDHNPVLLGLLAAAAEPTRLFDSPRVVESPLSGAVLDAEHGGTGNFTPIVAYHENNAANQMLNIYRFSDGSLMFQGVGTLAAKGARADRAAAGPADGRCIDITHSDQNPASGRGLSLFDCNNGTSQRWMPEYLGNDQFQLHSMLLPDLCMNIKGGQADPTIAADVILYACENSANERWMFLPAEPGTSSVATPVDLSTATSSPTILQNMTAGGVMDVDHGRTSNNTAVVSWQRTGAGNQGWLLNWYTPRAVSFVGWNSGKCLDIHNSQRPAPGRDTVIWDCTGQDSQTWVADQQNTGWVAFHSALNPNLCLAMRNTSDNPRDGYVSVDTCEASPRQLWLFTPFDPTGSPSIDPDPDFQENFVRLPTADPGPPRQRVAYFPGWSIYANTFYPKNLDTQGIAGKLTTLNYAFENIDPVNLTCFAANKSGSSDESNTTGNDGASDAWADYQRGFTAEISVDGMADVWDQPLKGNFNQLKKLKAKYPNLKMVVSLGGWTYSKYFSDVAATDASRKKFVGSCIDMYIKGNLPKIGNDPAGGQRVAAGIFDGFDIDWEFPASANGHSGNHSSTRDSANFTALLAEFRTQLDALGGQHYQLTAALPSGPGDIDKLQVSDLAQYLDLGSVMAYDMHGAWETAGPTNFQAPLHDSPGSPAFDTGLTADDAIRHYIASGFPADKLTLGVPLYGRGWTVAPGGTQNGRYQIATGPTAAFPFSQQPGVAMWKELKTAGKTATIYYDAIAKSSWIYDGSSFWSIETPDTLADKRGYIKDMGLAGIMIYSLEADDSSSTLLNAATGAH